MGNMIIRSIHVRSISHLRLMNIFKNIFEGTMKSLTAPNIFFVAKMRILSVWCTFSPKAEERPLEKRYILLLRNPWGARDSFFRLAKREEKAKLKVTLLVCFVRMKFLFL